MAAERRQKARSSPPRRPPAYGDGREPRPRSRSPIHGRDVRDHRDAREIREHPREPRPGPPRDQDDGRYRTSEGREKDPRDASYRDDGYDRFYRGEYDPYRKKEDLYADRYREPWNGRREPEEERVRPEERRRNELYRQYYEELQRRYDAERPVDCSVIVVNKQQKEYAETVGRKVRDLGMVVDLIFLNTEVSLTQALEDVSRARTPFAIIITQQHQVHRSCTVNILFGTPQEHRNMPMQDAMVLVAHNYDSFKMENRARERDEIARKAAKMADDVLMREHEREGHPVSLLTAITLLSEGRFLTPDELTGLINYLQDKRDRLVQGSTESHLGPHPSAVPVTHDPQPPSQSLPPASHQAHPLSTHPIHSTHLPPVATSTTSQQQELQAKILSLFNSGSGTSAAPSTAATPQSQGYSSTLGQQSTGLSSSVSNPAMPALATAQPQGMLSPRLGMRPPAGRMAAPQSLQRPAVSTGTGINFDNPSVQKALDTLIQSGPTLNHLVNSGNVAAAPRPGQSMGQGMSQGMGQGMSQGMGQSLGQGMGQSLGQGMGQGMSQGMGQSLVQGMAQGMGQGMAQGMGQGMAQGMGQGMAQGMGQGMAQGMGQGPPQVSHYSRHY
ncbi:nuclear receptor coactivator 5 isoform X2 [Electrophorus electricus]|nr:nuclear receptor coactivator 5 isoform X2 [Electrophorus electricus]XP_026856404.2 nuclear receptor coactivator 5 isoform X2 [Electrophorus electricus]